jgi:hypothetical protein
MVWKDLMVAFSLMVKPEVVKLIQFSEIKVKEITGLFIRFLNRYSILRIFRIDKI